MNVWGMWFTFCLPALILLGLMWAEYFYSKKKRPNRWNGNGRKGK